MRRDPKLAELLARALPPSEPGPGAEERVLAKIRRRDVGHPKPRFGRANGWLLGAAALLLTMFGVGRSIYEDARGPPAGLAGSGSPGVLMQPPLVRSFEVGGHDELLSLDGEVRVLARANSMLEVRDVGQGGIECRLEAGELLVHVPEGRGRPFEVVTRTARVLVTGTVFGVHVGREQGTPFAVTVWEGNVDVRRGDVRTSLGAGQHWPPESAPIALSESDLRRLAAVHRVEARASLVGHTSQVPRVEAAPASNEEAAPPKAVRGRLRSSAGRGLYLSARQLEVRGEQRRAAKLYERAAESGGEAAEAALFAAARLYSGMAEHTTAQRLLRVHRAQYAEGAYARAVDVLLLRTYVAQGATTEVEEEAGRFISRHPADPRASQFRWARARQWAKLGRCAEALAELPLLGMQYSPRLTEWCAGTSADSAAGE